MIRRHRERFRPGDVVQNSERDAVWQQIFQYAQKGVQSLEKHGLLASVTPDQLESLISFSQFIDFRDRPIPQILRVLFSLKLPLYLWLFAFVLQVLGHPVLNWAIFVMPGWWLLNNSISFPLFKYLLQPDPFNRMPSGDHFYYLRG